MLSVILRGAGQVFYPCYAFILLLFDNKKIVWNKYPLLLILCILILIPFFGYNNTWQVLLVMMRVFLKNKFNILILFLFAVIAFAGVLHHEIWRDEGQV